MTSVGDVIEKFQLEKAIKDSLEVKIEEEDTTEQGAKIDEEAQGAKRKQEEDERMVQDEDKTKIEAATYEEILEDGDLCKVFERTILKTYKMIQ